MGMFAYVNHTAPCQQCGHVLTEFQTKHLDDLFMQTVEAEAVVGGVFYTSCDKCGIWNEWRVVPAQGVRIEKA